MRARRAKAASIRASRRRARAYRTGGHCNARERRRGRARDRRWICSFTIAPREGFGAQSTLLGQLARVGKDDLRFPLVIADLPRHTDPLAKKRSLGGPEFRSIIHVHDGGENGIWRWLPKVQQRPLRLSVGFVFGGSHHTADSRRFSDVTCRILGAQVRRASRIGP
jgi:hypothetical protein